MWDHNEPKRHPDILRSGYLRESAAWDGNKVTEMCIWETIRAVGHKFEFDIYEGFPSELWEFFFLNFLLKKELYVFH